MFFVFHPVTLFIFFIYFLFAKEFTIYYRLVQSLGRLMVHHLSKSKLRSLSALSRLSKNLKLHRHWIKIQSRSMCRSGWNWPRSYLTKITPHSIWRKPSHLQVNLTLFRDALTFGRLLLVGFFVWFLFMSSHKNWELS